MGTRTEDTDGRGDAPTYAGRYDPLRLLASVLDRLVQSGTLSRQQADEVLTRARVEFRAERRAPGRSVKRRPGAPGDAPRP